MQKLPQPAEPCKLLGPTDRGIASARRRQDEDRRSAKGFCLCAEMAAASGKQFIDPLAVKGYDSRLGLTKLLEERLPTPLKLPPGQITGAPAGFFGQIGESNAMLRQAPVIGKRERGMDQAATKKALPE